MTDIPTWIWLQNINNVVWMLQWFSNHHPLRFWLRNDCQKNQSNFDFRMVCFCEFQITPFVPCLLIVGWLTESKWKQSRKPKSQRPKIAFALPFAAANDLQHFGQLFGISVQSSNCLWGSFYLRRTSNSKMQI